MTAIVRSIIDLNHGFAPRTGVEWDFLYDRWQVKELAEGRNPPNRSWIMGLAEGPTERLPNRSTTACRAHIVPEPWWPVYDELTAEELGTGIMRQLNVAADARRSAAQKVSVDGTISPFKHRPDQFNIQLLNHYQPEAPKNPMIYTYKPGAEGTSINSNQQLVEGRTLTEDYLDLNAERKVSVSPS